MTRILQSSWFVALIGGVAYLATTVLVLQPAKFASLRPAAPTNRSADDDPSWRFRNPEFNQWVAQIKEEKDALALREQRLTDLQNRLNAERQEIMSVTQTVAQLQSKFDRDVIRFNTQETENVKRQAKLIAAMSPAGAAAMVAEMLDDDVVRILFTMKVDEASAILDTLSKRSKEDARRAALLTVELHRVLPVNTNTTATTVAN
jgi:flagellar motility protein MotE (MotC chaperone)